MDNMTSSSLDVTSQSVLNTTTVVCNGTCGTTVSDGIPGHDPLKDVLDVLEYVNYVMLPTFLLLGLTGNSLTIVIMNTKKFKRSTSSLILMALAISDTCLLLTQPFNKMFVMKLIGFDIRAFSTIGCKMFFVFFKSGKMTSSWFIVFLCVERFVAVWFPLKAKTICTKMNVMIGIVCVYTVIVGFNIAWSIHSVIVGGICFPDVFDKAVQSEVILYRNMLIAGSSLYSLIPLCIICVLTPLIIFKLAAHRRKRKQMTTTKTSSDVESIRITAMLLGVVIAYFILIIPVTTLHNIAFYLGVKTFGDNSNGFLIFRDVAQILEQMNYSINFLMYVVTSRQFRDSLEQILRIEQCRMKLRNIRSSRSSSVKTTNTNLKNTKKSNTNRDSDKGEINNGKGDMNNDKITMDNKGAAEKVDHGEDSSVQSPQSEGQGDVCEQDNIL